MRNPELNKHFDRWLAQSLKKPVASDTAFVHRVMNRLDEQKARQLLDRTILHMKILRGAAAAMIAAAVGAAFFPPVQSAFVSVFNSLLEGLIRLIYQPTLTGIMAPVMVVVAAGVVAWNLIDMLSLE